MGMAAQHEVESHVDGAAIDLRRVRKEYGIIARPTPRPSRFDIICAEEMRVIHPRNDNTGVIALEALPFVHQDSDPESLDFGQHGDAVVITENGKDWAAKN